MTEVSPPFFVLTIIILAAIMVIFAMKYGATIYRSRLEARRRNTTDAMLDALRQEVNALTTRVGAIEKLLREVE
ncbi:hypothetical protein [Mesorhizobium sp. RMAD-H1]|uniref:hypothetical protein n=1 Tax=Mesorhizobium sp. RMAD-H1 TaxID=2587065 RepID=UPI001612E692|nr:hypothetical protein [Mesorhizobium sp. RMAD-H1]MBB2974145.1 hypothetical protein [Mesorhizobium sp. RMAD-H1]